MAKRGRPVLVTKNIDRIRKDYGKVARKGQKAVRDEFGVPFALQTIIAEKPRAKGPIFDVLADGQRFEPQKLNRLKNSCGPLKTGEVAPKVAAAVV